MAKYSAQSGAHLDELQYDRIFTEYYILTDLY